MSKGELLDAAWADATVEEANLSVQIALLRRTLGKAPDGTDWIVTVSRVGYRFQPKGSAVAEAPKGASLPSLVVMPFTNLGVDAGDEYFADGIVEDLTTGLARFKSLVVISRSSAFAYKGRVVDTRKLSREVGADYVLEGSVRRGPDRLRVTAQLIDGSDGGHLWADNFDGDLFELFDFQNRITDAVVAIVEPSVKAAEINRSRRERPGSLAAYDLFLRGQFKLRTNKIEETAEALALFDQALEVEPDNVRFLAAAASALQHGVSMGWPSAGPAQVNRLIEVSMHGLQVVADDAEALSLFGLGLVDAKESDLGYAALLRAFEINPNSLMAVNCLGIATLHLARVDDAEGYLLRALRLNSRDPEIRYSLTALAHIEMIRGNYEAALSYAERSFSIAEGFGATSWMLIAANALLGRIDEARRQLQKYLSLTPDMTIADIVRGQPNREPDRIANILAGLRLAGLPEH